MDGIFDPDIFDPDVFDVVTGTVDTRPLPGFVRARAVGAIRAESAGPEVAATVSGIGVRARVTVGS